MEALEQLEKVLDSVFLGKRSSTEGVELIASLIGYDRTKFIGREKIAAEEMEDADNGE